MLGLALKNMTPVLVFSLIQYEGNSNALVAAPELTKIYIEAHALKRPGASSESAGENKGPESSIKS